MELECLRDVQEVQDIQVVLLLPVQHLEHEVRLELGEVLLEEEDKLVPLVLLDVVRSWRRGGV